MTDISGIFSESFWYMAPILMVATTTIAGLLNGWIKPNAIWKQVIAWIVGAALSVGAYFAGLVQMGEPQWLGVVMLAIVVGLSSNGVYDIPAIKNFIKSWFPAKKPEESK